MNSAMWKMVPSGGDERKNRKNTARFAGNEIPIPESDCFMRTLSELGANPTAMAFSELYTALQQGVVDGHINPLVTIYANGLMR